jgi:hypothetical protein
MNVSAVEYGDVQGLVRFGYASLTEACFFLLKIRDASAARLWVQAAPASTATELKRAPSTALQIAFTHEGLRALEVPEQVLAGFSAEFLTGMSGDESRSRRMGDVGPSSPENWQWGHSERVPHLLVMLYAQPGGLEGLKQTIQTPTWATAFEVLDCLPTSNLYGVEPFGFTDGISQPELDWNQRRQVRGDQLCPRRKIFRRSATWDEMVRTSYFVSSNRICKASGASWIAKPIQIPPNGSVSRNPWSAAG